MKQQVETVLWLGEGNMRNLIPAGASFIVLGYVKSGKTTVANLIRKLMPAATVREKRLCRPIDRDGVGNLVAQPYWHDLVGYDMVLTTEAKRTHIEVRIIKSRYHERPLGPFKVKLRES